MKSKSASPDYFFFRAFAFFAFFAFLFFAIAALLATGCGDVGTVNIVDRRSPHLDYTRAMEKTPSPINIECTRALALLDAIRMSPCDAHRVQCKCANDPPTAMKSADIAKTHMKPAFSHTPRNRSVARARQKSLCHPQLASAANRGAVSFPPKPKKFFHRPRFESIARTVNRSKTNESAIG